MTTVREVMAEMERIAPAELALEGDNIGLVAGHPDGRVERVLIALDLTAGVAAETAQTGADMLILHHPPIYNGLTTLREDGPNCALVVLVRNGIAVFSAHTNLDKTPGGVEDCLADALGLTVHAKGEFLRYVDMPAPTELSEVAALAADKLGNPCVRYFGNGGVVVRRLALSCGSGVDNAREAKENGADALLTGDVRHHSAMDALAIGLPVIDAGHFHTERPVLQFLEKRLQTASHQLQWNIKVFISKQAYPMVGALGNG